MSKNKEEKSLRRKHRKEKEQKRTGGKQEKSGVARLLTDQAPLHGCWINQDWKTMGYAYIVVARKMSTGLLMFATFWLDTVKGEVKQCFSAVNALEQTFQQTILNKDKGIEFFSAELELVKELLATVSNHHMQKDIELPENFDDCLKLIGSLDDYWQKLEEQSPPPVSSPQNWRVIYSFSDRELIETELRQLPMLEECEDSAPEERRFGWWEEKKKWLLSKGETSQLGVLILKNDELLLESNEEKLLDSLHNSLVKFLGTLIGFEKKEAPSSSSSPEPQTNKQSRQ